MKLRLAYWRFLNFLVRRVVALGFVGTGAVISIWNLPSVLPGGAIGVNGQPSSDIGMRALAVALPLLVAGLGVLLFRANPFYPGYRTDTRVE